jgi:ABC-2 type transport system ATP-binding protein
MSKIDSSETLVDVTGLSKRFGDRIAVRDVNLRLDRGELIALVGANGGGKTTTLRMLAGVISPDAGTGHVVGDDVLGSATMRRASIGYLSQDLSLYPELSVVENLRFRAAAHRVTDADARIADAMTTYDLHGYAHTRIARLSGGWARRVQFAATLLHRPALLLLDEPTAGLDIVTRRAIWGWLSSLAAQGHGIVISTHDLSEAQRCPRLLFYDDGIATGPWRPDELIAHTGAESLDEAVLALATGSRQ